MAAGIVSLDGVDADALGLALKGALPGVFPSPDTTYPVADVPYFDGAWLSSDRGRVGARVLTLDGMIMQDTLADAEDAMQALKDAVSDRLVGIAFDHADGRAYYGVNQSCTAQIFQEGQGTLGWLSVSLTFLCPDPYAVDLAPFVHSGVAADRVPVLVGTGPTYGEYLITAMGASVTDPVLTLRDHAGNALGTLETDITIADGDWLRVRNIDGLELTKSVSGTVTSADDVLLAGYHDLIVSSRDGDRLAESWPTVEVDEGYLTVTGWRRWR